MSWGVGQGANSTQFSFTFFTPKCAKCSQVPEKFTIIRNIIICRRCIEYYAIGQQVGQKSWIAQAFDACVHRHQIERLKKALASVFHPDVGGSTAVMQEILTEADKRLG